MHRFFLDPEQCGGASLWLTGREAKHALQVLRLRRGETCVVLNGAGEELICEVEVSKKHSVELKVASRRRHDPPPVRLVLFQALPKGRLIEAIIQKATELGVARIVAVLTERAVPHLNEEASSSRVERWRQTAIEAIKQCGTSWLPVISPPVPFPTAVVECRSSELALVASLQPERCHVRDVINEFFRQHGHRPASVCLWVGPEGDFTPEEMTALHAAGAQAISLGRNVLRVDTAAIAGLAILQSELEAP